MSTDSQLDELAEKVLSDDFLRGELVRLRGGCSCFISPPCEACCNPLTAGEAAYLGLCEEEGADG